MIFNLLLLGIFAGFYLLPSRMISRVILQRIARNLNVCATAPYPVTANRARTNYFCFMHISAVSIVEPKALADPIAIKKPLGT